MTKHLLKSISYSAYRDYLKCPVLFWYRKILKVKLLEEPVQLVFGKALHSALELMVRDGEDPVEVFDATFTEEQLASLDPVKFQFNRDEGIRLLSFWKENHVKMLKEQKMLIKKTEIPFEIKVDEDPLTKMKLSLPTIRGVVDFTTSDKGIGDYKTSSKKYTQEMVDSSDQPTFYYLWHYIETGALPTAFYYIVFRKKIKKEPVQILKTTRTLTQVSQLLGSLQSVVNSINNREFKLRHKKGEFCDCVKFDEMLTVQL